MIPLHSSEYFSDGVMEAEYIRIIATSKVEVNTTSNMYTVRSYASVVELKGEHFVNMPLV